MILLHSATDDAHNINLLAGFISEYNPDIVISSYRDYLDWPRDYLCQKLNLENGYELSDPKQQYVQEFPLGKITRRHGRREEIYPWYSKIFYESSTISNKSFYSKRKDQSNSHHLVCKVIYD